MATKIAFEAQANEFKEHDILLVCDAGGGTTVWFRFRAAVVDMVAERLVSGSFCPQGERYAKPVLVFTTA